MRSVSAGTQRPVDDMDKIQRGINAQHLLDNELLKEVMNELDGTYHARWRNAVTVEGREDLFRYVKILEQITKDIQTIAMTGKLEEKRLDEWAKAERGTNGRT